ncbi:MAG TPA: ATP-binding cassette domain-containing protein, partial [Longimicrobiales bacterium]|nr:ATP-binding cassette domain-containing protein [Longimicrobiales bacterium]
MNAPGEAEAQAPAAQPRRFAGASRPDAVKSTVPPAAILPVVVSSMISVSGVSMRYGSKVLFEDVNATFSAGRRYGLTGPNGAGKSTFMKLVTGELMPQQGTIIRPDKLGVLKQDQYAFDQYRVLDTVIMG